MLLLLAYAEMAHHLVELIQLKCVLRSENGFHTPPPTRVVDWALRQLITMIDITRWRSKTSRGPRPAASCQLHIQNSIISKYLWRQVKASRSRQIWIGSDKWSDLSNYFVNRKSQRHENRFVVNSSGRNQTISDWNGAEAAGCHSPSFSCVGITFVAHRDSSAVRGSCHKATFRAVLASGVVSVKKNTYFWTEGNRPPGLSKVSSSSLTTPGIRATADSSYISTQTRV